MINQKKNQFIANSENGNFKRIFIKINQNLELALNAQFDFVLRHILIFRRMECLLCSV